MNKTTKGSLAAGAAAVLLLGGAGSLAYWTDSATVNGGSVNSGFLTLDDGDCDDSWVYAAGSASPGATVVNFVPGDIVTKQCTFVIGAEGDNLAATPAIPASVTITPTPAAPSFTATVGATYTLAGAAYSASTPITEDDDGDALVATILVTIPFGTNEAGVPLVNANDTQNITAALADLTVTLTQNET